MCEKGTGNTALYIYIYRERDQYDWFDVKRLWSDTQGNLLN